MGDSNYTFPDTHYTQCTTVNYRVATMQGILTILLIAQTVTAQTTNTKAASFKVNCGCQCSDLTFRDKFNRVQGNCKTADNTGAQWCYTEYGSTCEDQQRSTRFGRQGKTWSYQACSTPSIYSAQCAGYNGAIGGGVGGGIGGGICRNGNCGGNTGGINGGFNGNNGGFNGGFNGNNGGFNGNNGGFNGNNGEFNGGFGSGSIANCRHGQNCNVGNNAGLPTGQFNNGGFNPYNTGSSGLSGILQGRKTSKDKDSVKFGRK